MTNPFIALFRFLFWYWLPAPQIGERWTHEDHVTDPWNNYHYTVIKREGNWYRVRTGMGFEESKRRCDLVAFYRKTAEAPLPPPEGEIPF